MSRAMAGIDVGKGQLDVSVDEGKARRFANTASGAAELVDWLSAWEQPLAICEATGGYELLVVESLRQGEIPVHIAHPNQVRDFARACGYQAKTDGLDAVVLPRYGRVFQPPATLAQDADRVRLQELLGRREQLVGQRTQEKNRLSQAGSARARASIQRHIDTAAHRYSGISIQRHIEWLDAEIGELEREYRGLLGENVEFRRLLELYCSVPGVGPQTAATLIAWLPELGHWDGKALASLCGVGPWSRDSGRKRGLSGHSWGTNQDQAGVVSAQPGVVPQQGGTGRLLPPVASAWQAREGGPGGDHAQTAAATQRRGPPGHPVASRLPTRRLKTLDTKHGYCERSAAIS